MSYRTAIPDVFTTTEFAAMKGISGSRLRHLTRQGRVWPYKRTSRGDYLFFGNTVIIKPSLRPGRNLAKSPEGETGSEAAARVLREWEFFKTHEFNRL